MSEVQNNRLNLILGEALEVARAGVSRHTVHCPRVPGDSRLSLWQLNIIFATKHRVLCPPNSIQIGEVEAELDEYELDATGAT